MASSIGSHISGPSLSTAPSYSGSTSVVTPSFGAMFPDNSQIELERVMQSRLVESFITLTILQPPPSSATISPLVSPSTSRDKAAPSNVQGSPARKGAVGSPLSPSDKATTKSRRESAPRLSSRPNLSHVKSASMSISRPNGDAKRTPLHSATALNSPAKATIPIPQYFSPIHRPSTHPHFAIDASPSSNIGVGTDCSGSKLKIEVWGKVGPDWNPKVSGKGKERKVNKADVHVEWKILQERDIDLRDLVPLSDPSTIDTAQLPSNSLLITLTPPGEAFYLPLPPSSPRRSLSPTTGYASDPEPELRSAKQAGSSTLVTETSQDQSVQIVTAPRRRHRGGAATPLSSQQEAPATTAGWQELLKLVTLQSCILDNESSLAEVVRGIDKVLNSDIILTQRREIAERATLLEELVANHAKVIEDFNTIRKQIQARKDDIQQRKQMLGLAREQLQQDVEFELELEDEIVRNQDRDSSLRARFGPTRTTLIDILSSIYPIDLLSPPDLLYTILDVPLPIPLSSSDPAPPLTLPSHKDVNEDAVATALGYAAQVVQLLSAYLGKSLVYPVTYIGSRSLIRDNISAMVGPRMFPLYSKGVDTYRFEYGVFLLNKDIELLMADRDLRALDMRHTLPNLKNLLLTLTDGEGARLQRQTRTLDSPVSLASELELASRSESPVDPNSTTPKASTAKTLDGGSPPGSGSTTPTTAAMADASKKPRPFLGFSPLTDFLRGRYPSSSRISTKSNPDTEEAQSEEQSAIISMPDSGSDDEDRKTISGVSLGVSEVQKGGSPSALNTLNGGVEKLDNGTQMPAHSTQPLSIVR
ncbi:hypothetical protein DXG01_012495 [Tephrocybe rancida]|nr:hypothetical protein DXG01_012495 [Tephrocybe rancida]